MIITPRKIQIILLVLIAFFGGYFIRGYQISWQWANYKPNVSIISKEPPIGSQANVDFNLFWTVWDKLVANYYNKQVIDPQKMLYGAISGMVSSFGDPFTMFLPPEQQTSFQQQMAGQFEGIGAELSTKDGHIIVIAPLDGSPAEKAGIRAGDIIGGVDGKSTNGWTIQQAVDKIRGPKGTDVTLLVLHKDEKVAKDIKITRGTITVKSVAGWVKKAKDVDNVKLGSSAVADTSVMYVRLSQFGDKTNQDFKALVDTFSSQIKDGTIKGIILDLRNNPGGYLTDAQFVAGEFLPMGTTVVQEEDASGQRASLAVNRQGALVNSIPVVVLVNGGSASAAEIVSGALRDNKRAKLVGEKTFGKGTVQQALDLGGGAGLHVTIAKWLTPNGTWVGNGVDGKGLVPDVTVNLDPNDPARDTQLEKAILTVLGK